MGIVIRQNALLANILMLILHSMSGDYFRLTQHGTGNTANTFMTQSRRQHKGLAIFIGMRNHQIHVFSKAHIQHTICFIQNQKLQVLKFRRTTFDMVNQTTRCRNNNFRVFTQHSGLIFEFVTASQ